MEVEMILKLSLTENDGKPNVKLLEVSLGWYINVPH